MGVTGLWKLIDPSGKPVPLDSLENKILAVDISIWLHQVVKGFQDSNGATLANAHLLGLFHRLCKLLYYRIKPVFVFDGGVPQLKRETINKRSQNKSKYHTESDRFQQLLLDTLAKEKIVQQALGNAAANSLISPNKPSTIKLNQREQEKDDLFKLPPLKCDNNLLGESATSSIPADSSAVSDTSEFETRRRHYNVNLGTIDVNSTKFKSLPADIRVEILNDIKETRKQSSWGHLHKMPAKRDDFSEYQMQRLLRRRQVQQRLEEAEQEMGGKCLSLKELETLLTEDGIVAASTSRATKRIASDENSRYLHVSDLKKAMETATECSPPKVIKLENIEEHDPQLQVNEDYDEDLQRAIQLSLLQESVDEAMELYELKSPTIEKSNSFELKMSTQQKQHLSNTANSLARSYMIEYGGLNDDDVYNLLKQRTQPKVFDDIGEYQCNDEFITKNKSITPQPNEIGYSKFEIKNPKENNVDDSEDDVSSNADSDFIDVPEYSDTSEYNMKLNYTASPIKLNQSPITDLTKDFRLDDLSIIKSIPMKCLEIEIKREHMKQTHDDLFADVFDIKMEETISKETVDFNVAEKQKILINENASIKAGSDDSKLINEKSSNDENLVDVIDDKAAQLIAQNSVEKIYSNSVISDSFDDKTNLEMLAVPNILKAEVLSNNEIVHSIADNSDEITEKNNINAINVNKSLNYNEMVIANKKDETLDKDDGVNTVEIKLIKSTNNKELVDSIKIDQKEMVAVQNDDKKISELLSTNIDNIDSSDDEPLIKYVVNSKLPSTKVKSDSINTILNNLNKEIASVTKINLDNIIPNNDVSSQDNEKIFNDLNKEIESISQINLDNILQKVINKSETINEKADKIDCEIIEINDDDNDDDVKKAKIQSTLNSYFDVTPPKQKPSKQIEEITPKITQPFFVDRSPNSSKKKNKSANTISNSNSTAVNKVSKSLFGNDTETIKSNYMDFASNVLKDNKTEDELKNLATTLHTERGDIERSRNKQERMGMSITERMSEECKELLKLFGIPYVIAPMEAEAQCAYLNEINLTNGTITDDSDIWLFGGKTVYKHFFNQQKNVLEFNANNIERLFNINRQKLIQLAILVGSDYTTGISGVGAVTALEILSNFMSTPSKEGETTETMSLLSGLRKFRDWWENRRNLGPKTALRSKLNNIQISEEFPNYRVVEAYLYPKVDDSRESFHWGHPDGESIREFARNNFGWTTSKTNDILLPVLRKLEEKKTQPSITNYFHIENITNKNDLKVSKRVRKAIDKMSTNPSNSDNDSVANNNKEKTRNKRLLKTDKNEDNNNGKKITRKRGKQASVIIEPERGTSSALLDTNHDLCSTETITNGEQIVKKKPNIPQGEQPIPQREKDKELIDNNKKKAIEILKKEKLAKKLKK